MSWSIKGFSQDFDLETKAIQHWLVCSKEDGSEARLPVPETTVQELIRLSHSKEIQASVEPAPESVDPDDPDDPVASGATEFGGGEADLEPEDLFDVASEEAEEQTPENEEEVPSL
jgi:hypothetical protein